MLAASFSRANQLIRFRGEPGDEPHPEGLRPNNSVSTTSVSFSLLAEPTDVRCRLPVCVSQVRGPVLVHRKSISSWTPGWTGRYLAEESRVGKTHWKTAIRDDSSYRPPAASCQSRSGPPEHALFMSLCCVQGTSVTSDFNRKESTSRMLKLVYVFTWDEAPK